VASVLKKLGAPVESVAENLRQEVERLLKQSLRPEFLNRIDEIVVFRPLGMEEIRQIVSLQFQQIQEKAQKQGITLDLTGEAQTFLAKVGYDPAFGARPLKRTIQKLVSNPLANHILAGEFKKGDRVMVIVKENSLDFARKSF